jgi:hypothetical protein
MRLQILTLTIACLGAAPVWAGAGLTSAGVDPTPANNQQDEPTLAQVAPTQGTTGTNAAGTSAAGTVVPGSGTAAPQAGTVSGPGGTASGASSGAATAPVKALVATPPPPPDPATLPVSVIRPLNKPATDAPAAADASAPADTAVSPQQARVASPSVAAARPSATLPAQSMASGGLRAGATSTPPPAARAPAETAAEGPADASSSGFIFYTGIGIAAMILLLSLAAFFRGGGAESGKPGSM